MEEEARLRVRPEDLHHVVREVFIKEGLPEEDAATVADALLAADIRGIESHGVARIGWYVLKLQRGMTNPRPSISVVNENDTCALVDADDAMGPVAGTYAMNLAIEKAKKHGAGFVAVRKSNHFGIAGYYAMMALEHDMLGLATTNAVCMVAPTFGVEHMLGTNPIAAAFPCKREKPWVLDMATSTAPFGKLENARRNRTRVPKGWVIDGEGNPWDDPDAPMKGGALTPLGGSYEMGGHKGYGLAVLADILSAVLSGAMYGPYQEGLTRISDQPADTGHFFGAIRLDGFRPVDEFKSTMDEMIQGLRNSKKAAGCDRIYYHGEIEHECEENYRKEGIPLHPIIKFTIESQAESHGIPLPWAQ